MLQALSKTIIVFRLAGFRLVSTWLTKEGQKWSRLSKTTNHTASAEDFLNSGQQRETGCLIADIRMPGMSGLDLQARLNAEQCPIPIIFITAHGDEQMRLQAMRGGAVKFLAKPFDGAILLESVRAALGTES
jgi:FixJ family two-component response regulator